MTQTAGVGIAIYASDLADLESLHRDSPEGIDVSVPGLGSPANSLALDISAIVDMVPYVYKALVFINALGGTLKLADWIAEKLKARSSAAAISPAFVLDIAGKAYPIISSADLQVAQKAIESRFPKG
jgi:hypothetical protein